MKSEITIPVQSLDVAEFLEKVISRFLHLTFPHVHGFKINLVAYQSLVITWEATEGVSTEDIETEIKHYLQL